MTSSTLSEKDARFSLALCAAWEEISRAVMRELGKAWASRRVWAPSADPISRISSRGWIAVSYRLQLPVVLLLLKR